MVTMMRIIIVLGYASLHLFGNFYKLVLAVLMNWMRLCFEKKNSSFFSFHVKSVSSSSPATGAAAGAIGQRRGGAAAAGADRDTSVLRPLYVKYIGLKNGFYLNYHNQFKIKNSLQL